ncbi:MAG: hypothetical protein ACPGFA_00785 [Pikeienuella sp.]
MAELLPLHLVHDDDGLRVTRTDGESGCLVISFSGIGVDGSTCQPEEFIMTATDNGRHPALYVMDKRRSWLNAPGLLEQIIAIVEAEAARVKASVITTIGNSMGGFMALMLPYFTRIDRALAFSPQYAVDPAINPDEWRWRGYIEQIETFIHPTLEGRFVDQTQYTVLHGGHRRELPQVTAFPRHRAIAHFIRPGLAHGVGRFLKAEKIQHPLAQAVFEGRRRRVRILMKSAGFRPRRPLRVAA